MAESKKLKEALAVAVDKSTGPEVSPVEAKVIATQAVEVIKSDPVLANATGQERWWQSGVAWFGAGGILWSIGALFTEVSTHGTDFAAYDMQTTITALGSLAGFVGVLYRRFWPGLKPLFWRWGQG